MTPLGGANIVDQRANLDKTTRGIRTYHRSNKTRNYAVDI